jgi:hypothetical protein
MVQEEGNRNLIRSLSGRGSFFFFLLSSVQSQRHSIADCLAVDLIVKRTMVPGSCAAESYRYYSWGVLKWKEKDYL